MYQLHRKGCVSLAYKYWKSLCAFCVMAGLALFLTSCFAPPADPAPGDASVSPETPSTVTLEDVTFADTSLFTDPKGMNAKEAVEFLFSDVGITAAEGHGAEIRGTDLKIKSSGTYRISGTCADGSVTVAKGVTDVYLILDGLTLANGDGPAVTFNKTSSSLLYLAEGSENLLSDPSSEHAEGAAVKFKSGSALVIGGEGTLSVNGNSKNGIKGGAGSILRILSGNLTVTAENNALACDHSLEILGGTLNLTAKNDGIKASPDEDDTESSGNLLLKGGNVTVKATGDGISADGYLEISGGSWTVTTDGEVSSSGGNGGFGGGGMAPPGGFGGEFKPFGEESYLPLSAVNTAATADVSSKGVKAGIMKISGGEMTVSSTDHALHCGGEAVIEGGSLVLDSSKAKGIATHGDLTVSGENTLIRITNATEGIESKAAFVLNGGTVRVEKATDDGVNLGGTTSSTAAGLTVNGGTLYCFAQGDGLDSNRDFVINGGTVIVFGPSNGGNSCLDVQYTSTFNGGTVFLMASSSSMWNEVVGHTKGDYLYNTSAGTAMGAPLMEILSSSGDLLLSVGCPLSGNVGFYFMTDRVEDLASCSVKMGGVPLSARSGTGTGSSGMGGIGGGGFGGGGMTPPDGFGGGGRPPRR